MPRTAIRKRRPAEEDLSDTQRRIFEALPEDLRADYMSQLPDVRVSSALGRRKAQLIRERVHLLDRICGDLEAHKKHLDDLATRLEQGADPEGTDLRHELKPPALDGVALRFVRGPRG